LGVQTDSDNLLQVLGRQHTFEQAVEAVCLARQAGFSNLNLDLIFGIPGQTLTSWRECLAKTVNLSPQHVSIYNLQLEEETPLWKKVKSGQLKTCPEETELAMYEQAIEFLKDNNYIQYEISNFAQTGYQCQHNLRYWRNISYLGLGLSAHSYLARCRFNNTENINTYLNCLTEGKLPVSRVEFISKQVEMQETVFLGLRLMQGLDLIKFFARFGCCIEDVFTAQLKNLLYLGLVEINGLSLRLTKNGLPVANFVFREFV
jgi:oxygen-independent coproporphyrinogen-3 oxidase